MERKKFIKLTALGAVSVVGFSQKIMASAVPLFKGINDALCRQTWKILCGKLADREYMRYVGPQDGLPNVFIYGDSISQDYTEPLREEFKDKATVFRIFKNGGPSSTVIRNMKRLQKTMFEPYLKGGWDFKWDVIQFNVGLHDLKYLTKDRVYDLEKGTQVTPIPQYKKNLEEIVEYFKKEHPTAKLIYVLTTPVPKGAKGRKEEDAILFNNAAKEVLESHPDIIINDLYSFTKPNRSLWERGRENVHYNKTGSKAQAIEVAKYIRKALKMKMAKKKCKK